MRHLFIAFVFILYAPTALTAASNAATDIAAPVMMKSHVIVDGPFVLLSDLFEGAGDQGATAIARAPAPGKRVEVSARWLAAVAKAYGLAWRPTSRFDRAVVERSSQVIDTRRIIQEMLDILARQGVTGQLSLVLDQPGVRLDRTRSRRRGGRLGDFPELPRQGLVVHRLQSACGIATVGCPRHLRLRPSLLADARGGAASAKMI